MICMQFVTMLCKQFRCFQFRSILTFMCNVKGVGRGLILHVLLKLPKVNPRLNKVIRLFWGWTWGGGGVLESLQIDFLFIDFFLFLF